MCTQKFPWELNFLDFMVCIKLYINNYKFDTLILINPKNF